MFVCVVQSTVRVLIHSVFLENVCSPLNVHKLLNALHLLGFNVVLINSICMKRGKHGINVVVSQESGRGRQDDERMKCPVSPTS
jgi:hypothetical protein